MKKKLNIFLIITLLMVAVLIQGCTNNQKNQETSQNQSTSDSKKESEEDKDDNEEENDDKSEEDVLSNEVTEETAKYAVPGYKLGEIPAIEMPILPNLLIHESPDAKIGLDLTKDLQAIPGITIYPVEIKDGMVINGNTTVFKNEDGSGQYTDGNTVVQSDGKGEGQYIKDGITIQNNGDGSGQYLDDKRGITLQVETDGSGQYIDDKNKITFQVNEDGTGQYIDDSKGTVLQISEVGSASYYEKNDNVEITSYNYGDGTGTYYDDKSGLRITNDGKGIAEITLGDERISVKADPLEKVSTLPKLTPVPAIPAIEANGLVIKLDSGVLFDVNKYNIRPDAHDILTKLADILKQANISEFQINGHTDSDDTDEYNQTLSENRANSVKDFLEKQGVTANIKTQGFGEKQPIATNETKEGKQLNRRVEIVVPTH